MKIDNPYFESLKNARAKMKNGVHIRKRIISPGEPSSFVSEWLSYTSDINNIQLT